VTHYALWVHPHMLSILAVRMQFGQVTGVCPLPRAVAAAADLPHLEYDEREAAIARARDAPEQFAQFVPWLGGQWVSVLRRWR
jgi:hypothetical protein